MGRLVREPALVGTLGGNAREFATRLTWDDAADQTRDHIAATIRAHRATGERTR